MMKNTQLCGRQIAAVEDGDFQSVQHDKLCRSVRRSDCWRYAQHAPTDGVFRASVSTVGNQLGGLLGFGGPRQIQFSARFNF